MKTWVIIVLSIVAAVLIFLLIAYLSVSKEVFNTRFFNAIRNNDVAKVKKLVKRKQIDVNNFKNNSRYTPLAVAAMSGHVEMAEFLIEQNADVNKGSGTREYSPLFLALKEDHGKMAAFLIEKGADVNAVFNSSSDSRQTIGVTPLMMAVAMGNKEMVALLLDKGADITAKAAWEITRGRGTSMTEAASMAHMTKMDKKQAVEYLWEQATRQRPEDAFFKPPLLIAIATGNNEIAAMLLDRGADLNWKFETKSGDGYSPPLAPGMNALMYAALKGNMEGMELLLSKGIDIHEKDNFGLSAVGYAYDAGQYEAVLFLEEKGARIDPRIKEAIKQDHGREMLLQACLEGNAATVKTLVDQGIEINGKFDNDMTALMEAAWFGHADVVKVLLDAGADLRPYYRQSQVQTALYMAEQQGKWIIDPDKFRKDREKVTYRSEQEKERIFNQAVNLRGYEAQMYMQGQLDIYADVPEEKIKEYQEIIAMLKKAGAK